MMLKCLHKKGSAIDMPCAVCFRVAESLAEGTLIASWRRPLKVGEPLAEIPLDTNQAITIDLEQCFNRQLSVHIWSEDPRKGLPI